MKIIRLIDLDVVLKSFIKYTFSILIIFVFTTNGFSQECDEKTIARMIKSGLSDKTIEEQCGKIDEQVESKDKVEEEKVSENVESKDTVEEEKVSEKDPSVNKIWRFGGGDGSGTFKYSDTSVPALNGKFDHDLKGGNFVLNYITINKGDNFFYGGGWSSLNVSGEETFSEDAIAGTYTYYSSTYGYFDISVSVTSFRTNFLYGIYGYNYEIDDVMSLQPNIRYGYKMVFAEWVEKVEWRSYGNQEYKRSETFHQLGIDLVFPFVYKINENWNFGADICICGASGEATDGTGEYEFSNSNIVNLFFDYH